MYAGLGLIPQQQHLPSASPSMSVLSLLRRWTHVSCTSVSARGSGNAGRPTMMLIGATVSVLIITLQVILIALLASRRTHVVSTAAADFRNGHARGSNADATIVRTTASPLIHTSSSTARQSEHRQQPFLCSITRVRNEHVKFASFVRHQRREGFDVVYILDDRSDPPLASHDHRVVIAQVDFSDIVARNARAGRIVVNPYGLDTVREHVQQKLMGCEWIAYVDVDEFLITRRNETATVREELARSFTHANAVHVPWVFFGNNLQRRGSTLVHSDIPLEVMWRFNHSRHHQGYDMKTRDRFWGIETKSIFRPRRCTLRGDHFVECARQVEGASGGTSRLRQNYLYTNLHEPEIADALLTISHYRFVDDADILNKCSRVTAFKEYNNTNCVDVMRRANYAEVYDNVMIRRIAARFDAHAAVS